MDEVWREKKRRTRKKATKSEGTLFKLISCERNNSSSINVIDMSKQKMFLLIQQVACLLLIGSSIVHCQQQQQQQQQHFDQTNNLFFLPRQRQLADGPNQLPAPISNVIFPGQSQAAKSTSSSAIYINPNPSTRSTGANNGAFLARESADRARRLQGHGSSVASASEQSQVSEWPFFKSLQNARSAQMFNQLAPPRAEPAQQQQQQQIGRAHV